MSTKSNNYAATFKPKCLAMCLFALKLIHPVDGVLTQGMPVTADSIGINAGDPAYSNCLSGLVDGKLSPLGYSPTTHCCAHTAATTTGVSWLNINMFGVAVV